MFLFYLFYEINTKFPADSFYFSSYPFRKYPELEKNDAAQKKKKSHIEPKCHKVVLNSKAFAFSSNLQIWRMPIQWWFVNFDGIPGVIKCNL